MALWQYAFFVLPKQSVESLNANFYLVKDEDGVFDDAPYWLKAPAPCAIFNGAERFLPIGKSWSNNLFIYGNIESHCLEILCKDTNVVAVSFRIDFSKEYKSLLTNMVDFLQAEKLILVDEQLNIPVLTFQSLNTIIEGSKQFKAYFGIRSIQE